MAGMTVPDGVAVDSINVLRALFGETDTGRAELVTEGMQRKTLLRSGEWAFLPAMDGPRYSEGTGNETGFSHWDQLYRLTTDISQHRNVATEFPNVTARLRARLSELLGSTKTKM